LIGNKSNNYQEKINMKKILLSGIALIAACHIGFAQSFTSDQGWQCEHYSTGNQLIIVGFAANRDWPGEGSLLIIPSAVYDNGTFSTYTVTQLGNSSNPIFPNPNYPSSVPWQLQTPSCIQTISSYSFSSQDNLTQVVIDGTPTIESYAFYNDPNLINVPTICNDIGDSAFEGCVKLRSVGLKDGVTKIGKRAFANCKNLKSLTIPRTVISIEPDAFVGSGLKQVTVNRGQLVQYPKLPKGAFVRVRETAP
jgi:hypothetical protein